jgi:SAM-dependent methyltransferase
MTKLELANNLLNDYFFAISTFNVNRSGPTDAFMTKWEKFWNDYPTSLDEREFLRQVGHTVGGKPYSRPQFDAMIAGISRALQLSSNDTLLDVCCGNGIITAELAKHCERVVGVDFSAPLIDIARKFNSRNNLSYEKMNALDLRELLHPEGRAFSKFLMYAALQHFRPADFRDLLMGLLRHASKDRIILFGGVLDKARQHHFYNTRKKQLMKYYYRLRGTDRLGTWWDRAFISNVCRDAGLRFEIDDDSDWRPGGNYRFDVRIF